MFALDLFNNDHERRLAEGAVDQLEQRRIDDLAMKMDDLVARAKDPAYKKNPAALSALMKEFQKCKAERDSYYMVRNEAMGYGGLAGESQVTPTATGIRHHAKPGTYGGYEPEPDPLARLDKHAVNRADKALGVKFNREKKYQGGLDVDEAGIPGNVPTEKIPGKEDLLKGKGRNYYENQKKNSKEVDEGRMGEIDAMRQDLELMSDRQFYTAYGISKTAFQQKYRTLLKPALDEHGVIAKASRKLQTVETALNPKDLKGDYEAKRRALHDLSLNKDVDQAAVLQRRLDLDREAKAKGITETVVDVKSGMAKIYRRLAPKIERHRDSFLAGQLYDELENYAELHGAEGEFKRMMATARNSAHMEYDTNPGGFQNWFWFLPFEDNNVAEAISKKEQLNEFAPILAAGARLVIAMAPKIAQVLKSTGKATAKAVAPVAKSGSEIAAKNAVPIGVGLGAYEIGSSVADIARDITAKVGTALAEKTVMELAQVAFKFAIPAGIVLAILYGGKKVIDSLFSNSNPQQDVAEGLKPGEYHIHTVYFKDGTKKRIRVTTDEFDVAGYYTKRGQAVDRVDYDFQIYSNMTEAEKEPTTRQELLNRVDKIKRMMSQERNPANLQILRKQLEMIKQRYQHLKEDNAGEAVERAILNRIMVAHTDLLMKFGPDKVMQAAEEVAYNVGDVDEIGTSDVSAYVAQVKQILGVPKELDEKWSQKYKSTINCASPKGFSQKAHCAGKKK